MKEIKPPLSVTFFFSCNFSLKRMEESSSRVTWQPLNTPTDISERPETHFFFAELEELTPIPRIISGYPTLVGCGLTFFLLQCVQKKLGVVFNLMHELHLHIDLHAKFVFIHSL